MILTVPSALNRWQSKKVDLDYLLDVLAIQNASTLKRLMPNQ